MNRRNFSWRSVLPIAMGVAMGVIVGCRLIGALSSSVGQTYYVDCESTAEQSHGTLESPWKTLREVNAPTFGPGDSILLKRRMRCLGSLQPRGSGTSGAPITIGAYGEGPLPIIDAGEENEAAIRLFNQEYWHIESVETTGGTRFGIYVGGNENDRVLNHFRIRNVEVHDVYQREPGRPRWDAGLVIVAPTGERLVFNDVIIDTLTAHDTNQFYGIHVGVNFDYAFVDGNPRSTNITIRNSTVYNVPGDGITVAQSRNALIDNNVVHDVGYAEAGTITHQYTPNGIWSWASDQVTFRFNEGYRIHSYGVDGGVFDVDWGSTNTIIEYNYAHDSDAYCVAVLGLQGRPTVNTVIRYNICSNNDRKIGDNAADIIVFTADGGSIDGVQIYNNTIYSNSIDDGVVIWARGLAVSGTQPNFIKNNIIYSNIRRMIDVESPFVLDRNIYFYTGGTPQWSYDGVPYDDFASFQAGSLQEANGFNEDPLLNDPTYSGQSTPTTSFTLREGSPAIGNAENVGDMGPHDFFLNPFPVGGPFDIGAHQLSFVDKAGKVIWSAPEERRTR